MAQNRLTTGRYFIYCVALLIGVVLLARLHARASQQSPVAHPPFVVIDVIATDKRTGAPAQELTQDDFEVFDDRSHAHVSFFVHASEASMRPVSLWFVLQCPEEHSYYNWVSNGSGFLRGKTRMFAPVLQRLGDRDTVGVAHWCDDGKFGIDLLPTTDRGAPLDSLDAVLNAPAVSIGSTAGENALHDMVLRVRDTSQRSTPSGLPVLIFFYGDHSGMHHDEANDMLDQPLGPLPIVYGINNGAVSVQRLPLTNQYTQMFVVHFLSDRTGGQVLSNWHGDYAGELERIVRELHGRYELGFIPQDADGKHHELKVRLTEKARKKSGSVDLRFAPEYVASPQGAQSPESQIGAALLQTIQTSAPYTEIPFDATGRYKAPNPSAQFRVYVDPNSLSWSALENGDRKAVVALAIAGVSPQGTIIGDQVRQFEALQIKADQTSSTGKAVILGFTYLVPKESVRVRFVLRDGGSGHLGSFELPTKKIAGAMLPPPAPTSDVSRPQ
jgi:hypothetical protein